MSFSKTLKDPDVLHYSSSNTKFFITSLLLHTLLLCAGIVSMYFILNHHLVAIEDRLKVHGIDRIFIPEKEMTGNFKGTEGRPVNNKQEPTRPMGQKLDDIEDPGAQGLPELKGEEVEEVSEPSSVLVSPSILTVTQNQTAILHCNVHGNPKPKITWIKEPGRIDFGKTRTNISGLLEISNADVSDAGNYTCFVKSDGGKDVLIRTVTLLVGVPPRFTAAPEQIQTVFEGSTVNLTCAASGYPPPVITWSRVYGFLPSRRVVQINGQLTIRQFRRSDGVTYQCRAVNSLGESTVYTTLHMNSKLSRPVSFNAKFTNLGASGRLGPSWIGSDYDCQDHQGQVTLSSGIQIWTVPYTARYRIEAVGASGGYDEGDKSQSRRGRGARMIGTFALVKGERIKILVGQEASYNYYSTSGGGGGSFVAKYNNTPLIVAGGGGGVYYVNKHYSSSDGNVSTSGNPGGGGQGSKWPGGINGQGATKADSGNSGGGGGGFYSNGHSGSDFGGTFGEGGEGGRGFLQGGAGGRPNLKNAFGGFGGGGGGFGWGGGAGGGGGYSGGASGDDEEDTTGGGGGSFNSGSDQSNTSGYNSQGHGYVIISMV